MLTLFTLCTFIIDLLLKAARKIKVDKDLKYLFHTQINTHMTWASNHFLISPNRYFK